ncbi:hypothetical protein ES705_40667 [subsurface metagenome]
MYYKSFDVTGVLNTTQSDAGLVSLVDKPVRVRAILINTDTHRGNIVEGWIGTDRILEIFDWILDTQVLTAANVHPRSQTKIIRIPIEENTPIPEEKSSTLV